MIPYIVQGRVPESTSSVEYISGFDCLKFIQEWQGAFKARSIDKLFLSVVRGSYLMTAFIYFDETKHMSFK